MRERRRFDDEFKAKVALEALKEEKTLQELAEDSRETLGNTYLITVPKILYTNKIGDQMERRITFKS